MSEIRRLHLDRRAAKLASEASSLDPNQLLSVDEVAAWLGTSKDFLNILRSKGGGPKFIRLAPRRVRYKRGEVAAWLDERAHVATHEYPHRAGPGRGHRKKAAEERVVK